MANSPDLVFIFLVLLGGSFITLVCPGAVTPHPLHQFAESIVPERDLTPRNFNPHPYVSAVARTATVLSNFDHPYAAVASKRSGYFREGSNSGQPLDNRTGVGKTSINSLANFARRFLGLNGFSDKKKPAGRSGWAVGYTNDPIVENGPFYTPVKFSSTRTNYPLLASGGYRVIATDCNPANGKYKLEEFATGYNEEEEDVSDVDGSGAGRFWLPFSTLEDQRRKLYLGNTLNLASVQQSSLNEDALSLGDTNDNLRQGLYVSTDEDEEDRGVSDGFGYLGRDKGWVIGGSIDRPAGIESHNKPLYFITADSDYRNSISDRFHLGRKRYPLYHLYEGKQV